ncbi:capsular exopolysaccharide synthesis family protein [Streptacidiphilus sp. MAP12-16]|uniref:polysaccharide biosynthesis tyrosine autokinase n=1 Tax=Streptacidiphilus sp. MAP12-16 TaxID=3156300 RepID=UPI00351741B5
MDLRDYVRVLRERWRIVIACLVIGLAAAAAAVALTPRTYTAHAQLFVATSDVNSANAYQGGLFSQERVQSYTQIIDSPSVINGVIATLGLHTTPEQLAGQISATAPLDTVLIDIKVTDTSPQQAQAIANATASQFTTFVAGIEPTSPNGVPLVKVSAVGPSVAPTAPTSPQSTLYLGIGAVVGLALGVSGALVRAAVDTRIKTRDDIRQELGLRTLGAIPFDSSSRRTPRSADAYRDASRSARTEAVDQLCTSIRYLGGDDPARSMVVTSALRAEGRTTTAVDLAVSLAQAGRRVILVEGDLRRPRLAELLGLAGTIGLTDVLRGTAELDSALQDWGDGLLRVVVSGGTAADPTELLARPALGNVLRALEARADLVLLDSPPLLPFTDGAVLAAEAGSACLVVRSGRTSRAQAHRALDCLAAVDARMLGVVLTMASKEQSDTAHDRRSDSADGCAAPSGPRPTPWSTGRDGEPESAGSPLTDGVPVLTLDPPSTRLSNRRT